MDTIETLREKAHQLDTYITAAVARSEDCPEDEVAEVEQDIVTLEAEFWQVQDAIQRLRAGR